MDDTPTERYFVSAAVILSVSSAETVTMRLPAWQRAQEISRDEMEVLLRFSRPASVRDVFRGLKAEWDVKRSEIEHLVGIWVDQGVLVSTREQAVSRLELFQRSLTPPTAAPPPLSPFALQRPDVFYPGLGTREIHDRDRFAWTTALEANTARIEEELAGLLANRSGFSEVYGEQTASGAWAAAYFWVFGRRIETICEACPWTARLLESIPGVTTFSTVLFSALAPKTIVSPHCGVTNAKLRCQLPLIVPDGCGLRVGDSLLRQRAGRCLIFDDSFVHSAWNLSDRPRFVLLFDFYHPDLTAPEVDLLERMIATDEVQRSYLDRLDGESFPEWLTAGAGSPAPPA